MARKRRRRSARNSTLKGAILLAVCASVAVGAVVAGQTGLDALGRAMLTDRATTTAAIPVPKTGERLSMPSRMAAPAARPAARPSKERTRLNAATALPRPPRAMPEMATPAVNAHIPRPPVGVPGSIPRAPTSSAAGLVPARKPQSGDCACPYDLMLNGSACGARSTYLTPGREKPACYR